MASIVYPKLVEYDFMKQRPHHLMEAFARIGLKAFFFNLNSGMHGAKKRKPGVEEVRNNLFVVSSTNKVSVPRPYIYYYTYPPSVDDPVRQHADFVIFDCVDEPTEQFAHWARDHRRAIRTSDLVLASSKNLYLRALKENKPVLYVPNGVDFDHFATAINRAEYPPHELRPIKKPIIGYYGAIGGWFDTELVEYAADQLPDYEFVIIGPYFGKELKPAHNIKRLPHVPYEQLPRYLSMFDVCIIPFNQDSEVVKSCNPLKYWEYLAAGKPVVTTDMPECDYPVSYVSKDQIGFVTNLVFAVNEKSHLSQEDYKWMIESRQQLAKDHSWDTYAMNIILTIEELKPEWFGQR
jgi:glycosyltransferase involved in cell wall biosynthesis